MWEQYGIGYMAHMGLRFAPYTPYGHHMGQVDLVWAIFGPCHIIPTLIPYNPSWAHKPPDHDTIWADGVCGTAWPI